MVLTPQERRGLMVIVGLLLLGTAYDLWQAARPPWTRPPAPETSASVVAPPAASGSSATSGDGASDASPPPADAASPSRFGVTTLVPQGIDLNAADATTLDRLPGVGPVLAGRIIAHRAAHGPFERVEDLRAVRGIGPRLLERLRPWVRVSATRARR